MKIIRKVSFIFLLIIIGNPVLSQSPSHKFTKGSHPLIITFGGITKGGEIAIMNHLEDSLSFTDQESNEMLGIASFHLAVKCNGNVLKYMENKSGNKLTAEMKEAVRELLPGCALTFDGIKAVHRSKNISGWGKEFNPGMLKLTLK